MRPAISLSGSVCPPVSHATKLPKKSEQGSEKHPESVSGPLWNRWSSHLHVLCPFLVIILNKTLIRPKITSIYLRVPRQNCKVRLCHLSVSTQVRLRCPKRQKPHVIFTLSTWEKNISWFHLILHINKLQFVRTLWQEKGIVLGGILAQFSAVVVHQSRGRTERAVLPRQQLSG